MDDCKMRVAMIFLAALSTTAVKAETLSLATAPDFFEELLPAARISGSLVAGVQLQGPSGDALRVAANVPAAWAGEIACARVISIDGTYEATNEYSVPAGWTGGQATLEYPTLHEEFLQGRKADGIGLRVSRGPCDGKPEEVTISSWNNGAGDTPAILVNSFQADVVFAYIGETSSPVRCTPVALEGRSAFDVRCPIEIIPKTPSVKVEILRVTNGQASPSSSFLLWLPES
ncbi:hypothetical protein ILP92_11415 [Maribius pontilimi]|uniref:Uncharacterized protein n=1 Tax=Palleronia pontilimi TaxID=1964209 RepID=A0A934MHI7_9RHOB|nr:hypothetical protein [Palleronia pontilimi]MBJ3763354.1 hypothetical protein [Palleronia pontilimi]